MGSHYQCWTASVWKSSPESWSLSWDRAAAVNQLCSAWLLGATVPALGISSSTITGLSGRTERVWWFVRIRRFIPGEPCDGMGLSEWGREGQGDRNANAFAESGNWFGG